VSRIDYPFAVAESVDEGGRYRGLVAGQQVSPALSWLLVNRDVAEAQIDRPPAGPATGQTDERGLGPGPEGLTLSPPRTPRPRRRFHGVLELGPEDFVKKAGPLWDEILLHLKKAPAAKVRVRLVVEAESPEGFAEEVRRIVQEKANALRFREFGFED
jgi:hypothetical protein